MYILVALFLAVLTALPASAQIAPTEAELRAYGGLHAAAARGDVADIEKRIAAGENKEAVDIRQRTPLHVAVFHRKYDAARALIRLGADPNRLEIDRYDIVTIASVANDVPMLKIALEGGGNARAVTSRYDGTALIAAAHLGHAEVVRMLIAAGGAARSRQQSEMDRADRIHRARRWRQEPYRYPAGSWSRPAPTSTFPTAPDRLRSSSRKIAAIGRWWPSWKRPARSDRRSE